MVCPIEELRSKLGASRAEEKISVLAINSENYAVLEGIFDSVGWRLFHARNCEEALECLRRHSVKVVICEHQLPGSGWKDVLRALGSLPQPPLLIVTSRLADDHLWSEVLNLGGYDVLAQPFDGEEVLRVVGAARRHFEFEAGRHRARTATAYGATV